MEPTNKIKALLEKYWLAETTDADEAEIRKYFLDHPGENDDASLLFAYFHQQQSLVAGEALHTRLQEMISVPRAIPIWRRSFWKVAAALLILVSTVVVIQLEREDSIKKPLAVTDTYRNPEQALGEARRSLFLIAEKLNKAKQYSLEIRKVSNELQVNQLKKQP